MKAHSPKTYSGFAQCGEKKQNNYGTFSYRSALKMSEKRGSRCN